MKHMQALLQQSLDDNNDDDQEAVIFGHSLMFSCPPLSQLETHPSEPFQYDPVSLSSLSESDGGHRLATLLDLSSRLDLDGELTVVMAWDMILTHPRASQLTLGDLELIKADLVGRCRCQGYYLSISLPLALALFSSSSISLFLSLPLSHPLLSSLSLSLFYLLSFSPFLPPPLSLFSLPLPPSLPPPLSRVCMCGGVER